MRVLVLTTFVLAQTMPAGITRTPILDNETVMVARLTFAPDAREQMHTHPFSAVVVHLGSGDVETRIGTRSDTARRDRGHVDFIAAEMPHAAANVGAERVDVVTIALKPSRRAGGDQPPTPARAGIARTPILDNSDTRVARAVFDPGAREPVHTHPFDMVIVQLDSGRIEVEVGGNRTTKDSAIGEVVFLPRDVPHSVANVDGRPLTILSVAVR